MTAQTFVSTRARVSTALWHANREIQSRDLPTKQHHRTAFCDVIENADCPTTVLHEVVRRLGRARAMMIEIEPRVINYAVRQPKIFEGRL